MRKKRLVIESDEQYDALCDEFWDLLSVEGEMENPSPRHIELERALDEWTDAELGADRREEEESKRQRRPRGS